MWDRKHVEFIRYDEVGAEPLSVANLPEGLRLKTLSVDESDGALSGILEIPPGWEAPGDLVLGAPEQLFILRGDLSIGDQRLTEQFYRYTPADGAHGRMLSEQGCEAIVMWDAALDVQRGDPGSDGGVILNDTIRTHWEPTVATGPAAGIKVKRLREVDDTGEMTFIVGIMPNWYEPRQEHHPCVEESFKIFGDMNLNTEKGERMIMPENSYFYRPPWIKHGPLYTRTGTMSIVRVSSTLVNRYMPLEEDPEYLEHLRQRESSAAPEREEELAMA